MFTVRNVLTFFHVLCAIVGFGWVLLVGMQFKRAGEIRGAAGAELFASSHKVTRVAEIFIYLTGAFGLAAALTIPEAFKQMWLSISMAVYIVALVISIGFLQPTARKLARMYEQAQGTSSPQLDAEIEAANKRSAAMSGVLDLFFVVMLFLMIFKWPS
ncbi:MAG: DUF2269 family protein [Acidimicrobiia bacterium]|nr:DUF2269 family protein [Acidimicrobiia bacterium]